MKNWRQSMETTKNEENEGRPMRNQWKPMENKSKVRKVKEIKWENNERKPM